MRFFVGSKQTYKTFFYFYFPYSLSLNDTKIGKATVIRKREKIILKRKTIYYLLTFFTVLSFRCESNKTKEPFKANQLTSAKIDSLRRDSATLTESFNKEDIPANDYFQDKLKPSRENFKRINSISRWTSIVQKELLETTEGGEAKFYYQNKKLEKVVTHEFGETFQQLKEYYLISGKLSFVYEKSYKYNRPMYYDSAALKENNDSEVFDFKKSEIIETRSYFDNEKLLHQLTNEDCGSPFSDDYLNGEQSRINKDFEKLIKLGKRS